MHSSSAKIQARPFYWKEPVVEKDYMHENIRRIRAASSQLQNKREPLKAHFVPGVTKNSRYEHVTSRLAGIIRPTAESSNGVEEGTKLQSVKSNTSVKFLPDKFNPALNGNLKRIESISQSSNRAKPIWGASEAANYRRLSKSTTDLSSSKEKCLENNVRDLRVPFPRRKKQPIRPQDESIYNWRFSDPPSLAKQHVETETVPFSKLQPDAPNIHYHRVEYLPCDGICAEENITANGDGVLDSGRSSISSRTSRGVNTEETRIFHDEYNPLLKVRSLDRIPERPVHRRGANEMHVSQATNTIGSSKSTSAFDTISKTKERSQNPYEGKSDAQLNRIRNEMSSLKLKEKPVQNGGDMPHNLGTLPKYLKQRQQEWKFEAEARKEAEKNKDVPPGHLLMSDKERIETLDSLRRTYDSLVDELNRIPIRMDTIRVRDQKIKLEQQFEKLEQAIRIFSRPRVFVKQDQ